MFQNQLVTEAWDMYFTLSSLSMIPQFIFDNGVTNYVNKKLLADRLKIKSLCNETTLRKAMLSIVFILALVVAAYIMAFKWSLAYYIMDRLFIMIWVQYKIL